MPNVCTFPDCPHTPSIPENIKRGRCSLHPPRPAAVATPRAAGPVVGPVAVPWGQPRSLIEAPTTGRGWYGITLELGQRVKAYADGQDVPIALPGRQRDATIPLRLRVQGQQPIWGYKLMLDGDVTLPSGRMYYVRGLSPWSMNVVTHGTERPVRRATWRRVAEFVRVAWEADGAHTDLLALFYAYAAAREACYEWEEMEGPGLPEESPVAHVRLLRLAATDRLQGGARAAALRLVENGYTGSAQDMLDAATALMADQPGR